MIMIPINGVDPFLGVAGVMPLDSDMIRSRRGL
jgi:hypothetical protein